MQEPSSPAARLLLELKTLYLRLAEEMQAQLAAARAGEDAALKQHAANLDLGIQEARALEARLAQAMESLEDEERAAFTGRSQGDIGAIEAALQALLEMEAACGEEIRGQKARLGESLKNLRRGKTLLGAYSGQPRGGGKSLGNI